VRLLSYPTIAVADIIPQSVEGESFEVATEFGIPRAIREPADYLRLGYNFRDYDKSIRSTWRFLREATADQVTAQVTRVFEADNRLVTGTIMNRLLNPAVVTNEWQYSCYGLWNADGMVPPEYLGNSFDGTHTHYLTSGSTTIDSQDIEDMIKHVTEHGYGRLGAQGGQLISSRAHFYPRSSPPSISLARCRPPISMASKYWAATPTRGLLNPITCQLGM
jgi:hypothetical protein